MAIDINQLQLGGLFALAGNQAPNLNLKLTGFSADQALQSYMQDKLGQQQLEAQYANMANNLLINQNTQGNANQRAQFKALTQAQENQLNRDANASNILLQNKLQQQLTPQQLADLQMRAQELGIKQQQLGVDQQQADQLGQFQQGQLKAKNQENQIKAQKNVMEQVMKMDEVERDRREKFLDNYFSVRQQIEDPDQQSIFDSNWKTWAEKNKVLSKQDAEAWDKTDPNMRMAVLGMSSKILKSANKSTNNESKLAEELTKSDVKQLDYFREASNLSPDIINMVDKSRQLITNIGDDKLGPVVDFTKLNKLDPTVQELQSNLNSLAFLVKGLYKVPSNTFSEADRDFLTKMSGNTAMDKTALLNVLNTVQDNAYTAQKNTWSIENKLRKRETKTYSSWVKDNPEPITPKEAYEELQRRQGAIK